MFQSCLLVRIVRIFHEFLGQNTPYGFTLKIYRFYMNPEKNRSCVRNLAIGVTRTLVY